MTVLKGKMKDEFLRNDNTRKLEVKVNQLEEKVSRLETTLKEQEVLRTLLQSQRPFDSQQSVLDNFEKTDGLTARSAVQRTCREIRAVDPSLKNGV